MKIYRFSVQNNESYAIEDAGFLNEIEWEEDGGYRLTGKKYTLDEVKVLPPSMPTKVVCVGLNYYDHAEEMNMAIPQEPVIFLKPNTTVIGNQDNIVYPEMSSRVDYEAELAIVIGRRGKDIPEQDAKDYILGYTCANDVTARDLQSKDGQWTRAKCFDTFLPLGPCIETELSNVDDLKVELFLNGELKQSSRTSRLIFSVEKMVSFISKVMTLYPGDIIITGTPAGIGPMQPGDKVEVKIEGIGTLINTVAK